MATVAVSDYSDLVIATLSSFDRLRMTDMMSDYQNTYAVKRVINSDKTKTEEGGKDFTFFLKTDHNNSARFVGLAYVANPDIKNNLISGTVPWRIENHNYSWEHIALAMNAPTSEKLVDLLTSERVGAVASYILRMESAFWRAPASTDTVSPYGIPYYVVKSATATTTNDGFNGTVPSGYTTVAGINPTTYRRYRNYAFPYTNPTHDDLVRRIRRAMEMTKFERLVEDMPTWEVGQDRAIYMSLDTMQILEEVAEDQNDRLGNDLDPMGGKMVIRGHSANWVKELNSDTTGVVYGIDWSVFWWYKLRGNWMKETHFPIMPNQPTTGYTDVRCVGNLACVDRRRQWVGSTGTTMPA